MHSLAVILLGVAANLDNLVIGMVYGLRGIRLPFRSNLVMALLSGLAILISGYFGRMIGNIIPPWVGSLLGGGIVALMGLGVLYAYLRDQDKYRIFPVQYDDLGDETVAAILKQPEKADLDNSGDISWREALGLGVALALNCLTMGIGVGMTGLNLINMTITVIVSSLLAISLGLFVGRKYGSTCLGNYATPVAGSILLLVGIYEMLL